MTSPKLLPTRVRSVTDVAPHVREIELIGPHLPGLHPRPGAHLVVRVPDRRVYSIWSHRPGQPELTIRVVLHPAGGPGCAWARTVTPGDRITVEPPRSKISIDPTAAFHLFAGEETAAVPLLAMRAAVPRDTPAFGVLESADTDMPGPEGIPPLPWVHRGTAPATASRVLLRAVQSLDLPTGPGAAYIAGESHTCRLLQRHLIEQRGWPRHAIHLQPQWLAGRPGFGAG